MERDLDAECCLDVWLKYVQRPLVFRARLSFCAFGNQMYREFQVLSQETPVAPGNPDNPMHPDKWWQWEFDYMRDQEQRGTITVKRDDGLQCTLSLEKVHGIVIVQKDFPCLVRLNGLPWPTHVQIEQQSLAQASTQVYWRL